MKFFIEVGKQRTTSKLCVIGNAGQRNDLIGCDSKQSLIGRNGPNFNDGVYGLPSRRGMPRLVAVALICGLAACGGGGSSGGTASGSSSSSSGGATGGNSSSSSGSSSSSSGGTAGGGSSSSSSGGAVSGSSSSSSGGTTSGNVSPGGLFSGTFYLGNPAAASYQSIAAIDEQGNGFILNADKSVYLLFGKTAGNTYSGTVGGANNAVGTFTATVQPRVSISGSFSFPSQGASDTFTYTTYLATLYQTPSSFATLAGNFQSTDSNGYATTWTINSDGSYTEQETFTGCTSSGNFSIIDSSYNIYSFTQQLATCDNNPGFTANGYAVFDPASGTTPENILVVADNGAQQQPEYAYLTPPSSSSGAVSASDGLCVIVPAIDSVEGGAPDSSPTTYTSCSNTKSQYHNPIALNMCNASGGPAFANCGNYPNAANLQVQVEYVGYDGTLSFSDNQATYSTSYSPGCGSAGNNLENPVSVTPANGSGPSANFTISLGPDANLSDPTASCYIEFTDQQQDSVILQVYVNPPAISKS